MQKGENLNRPARGSTIKVEPIRRTEDIAAIKNLLVDTPRNLALFTLGINTGLRVSELLKIKIGHFQNLNKGHEQKLRLKRGRTLKEIKLDNSCIETVRRLIRSMQGDRKKDLNPSGYLFSGPRGSITVPTVNNLVKKWCTAVNLKGNYGGHTLRKTFGYHQLVLGKASLPEIMVRFNHSSPLQTLTYLCIQPGEVQDIQDTSRMGCAASQSPAYEELIQRNKELEKAVSRLRESEEKYRTIFENVNDEIIYLDKSGTILEINEKCEDLFGLKREEVIGRKFFEFGYMDPEKMQRLAEQFRYVSEETTTHMEEFEIVRTDGASVFIEANSSFIESEGERKGSLAILRDVTERKRMEKELQAYRDHLEELVKERTANLEEANAALRVMLRKGNEVKEELEEKILINVKNLILPALEKIKNGDGRSYLDFIEYHLNNILSSFSHKLTSKYFNLTTTQLRIANLVKYGKTTKEIAELLNLSTNTIHFHRANIRKKAGLSKYKTNLRSFLLSLE